MSLKVKRFERKERDGEREMFGLQVENTFQRFTFIAVKDWNNSRPADQQVFQKYWFLFIPKKFTTSQAGMEFVIHKPKFEIKKKTRKSSCVNARGTPPAS